MDANRSALKLPEENERVVRCEAEQSSRPDEFDGNLSTPEGVAAADDSVLLNAIMSQPSPTIDYLTVGGASFTSNVPIGQGSTHSQGNVMHISEAAGFTSATTDSTLAAPLTLEADSTTAALTILESVRASASAANSAGVVTSTSATLAAASSSAASSSAASSSAAASSAASSSAAPASSSAATAASSSATAASSSAATAASSSAATATPVGQTAKAKRRRQKLHDKKSLVCAICGSQASGFNFGALTCDPCKAFFRRNAHKSQDKIEPCHFDNNCKLDSHTRKFCTVCRLKKCFAAEMKKEWILNEEALKKRKKITKKTKATQGAAAAAGSSSKHNEDEDKPPEPLSEEDKLLINYILDKHKSIDVAQLESQRDVNNRGYTVESDEFDKLTSQPEHGIQVMNMVNEFLKRFFPFLKSLPYFDEMHDDDRTRIVRQCVDETLVLRSAIQYDPKLQGFSVKEASSGEEKSLQMTFIKDTFGTEMYEAHMKFVTTFNSVAEWDKPTMILTMIVNLFSPDVEGLLDKRRVEQAQEHYSLLLQAYLRSKYSYLKARQMYPNLLMILYNVRKYGEESKKAIQQKQFADSAALEPVLRAVFTTDEV